MKPWACAALVPLCSCVSFRWDRVIEERPLEIAKVRALEIGRDDLASCVRLLGAPTHVWPRDAGEIVLAWGSASTRQWGFRVSAALRGTSSPVFDFDSIGANTVGHVLWFDRRWILQGVHFGHLKDLANGTVVEKSAIRFDENGARAEQP